MRDCALGLSLLVLVTSPEGGHSAPQRLGRPLLNRQEAPHGIVSRAEGQGRPSLLALRGGGQGVEVAKTFLPQKSFGFGLWKEGFESARFERLPPTTLRPAPSQLPV